MPNQKLIYQIAAVVYEEFGANLDDAKAEKFVTQLYRAVEPFLNGGETALRQDAKDSQTRLVVSVFGIDHAGIVAEVTKILAEAGCSIIDINQTVVSGKFAMVIIVNYADSRENVSALKERFNLAGGKLGVKIYLQREDLFNAMHRI